LRRASSLSFTLFAANDSSRSIRLTWLSIGSWRLALFLLKRGRRGCLAGNQPKERDKGIHSLSPSFAFNARRGKTSNLATLQGSRDRLLTRGVQPKADGRKTTP